MEICELYGNLNPKLVILFGSYARGDYTEESDIDVLVVSDDLPTDPREAFHLAFRIENPKIEPTAMNTGIFMRKLEEGSTFILEIIEEGKILCRDEKFIEEVKSKYSEIRRRFKRGGKVWSW